VVKLPSAEGFMQQQDAKPARVARAPCTPSGYPHGFSKLVVYMISVVAVFSCYSGNVIGYAVAIPCRPCLDACNNGHYYMFYSHAVDAAERLDSSGTVVTTLVIFLFCHFFMSYCL